MRARVVRQHSKAMGVGALQTTAVNRPMVMSCYHHMVLYCSSKVDSITKVPVTPAEMSIFLALVACSKWSSGPVQELVSSTLIKSPMHRPVAESKGAADDME